MNMNKGYFTFSTLSSAIAEGDIATLRAYLQSDSSNANECDEYGQTLLMIASQHGQTAIVNELVTQGADVNAEDSDNWSALMNAAKGGHNDIVLKLLEHGAQIEKRDMGSWTSLMWACYKGHYQVVQTLLNHNAVVNVYDKFHCTCLIWAAGRGYLDIVKLLLENGSKVNSGDKFGSSPLLWACRKGFSDIVHGLLEAGANVDTAGMFSWTPLIVATKGNYTGIVSMLLEHRPNVNAVDMDGCTALTIACKEGFLEIAGALMGAGAYINLQDRNGDTNLIHAAKAGHFCIVDALLKKYADVDLPGSDRKTALYWAVEKGYADVVRLLLVANPNLESTTKDGNTPLLKATRMRHAEIVQLLVDKKCKVSVADKKGDTALHIAMRARSKAIVEILLRNPKNSQLLYRPNRAGETPYIIDTNHKKSILAQIFGARRLNTNEDSENRLGYDLYSSALADILSEPSLSMPISVGLYAKWGSGKSFLLNKLENEMRSFAIQWLEPSFEINWLVFLIVTLVSLTLGFVISVASHMWVVGIIVGASVFVASFIFLGGVIYGSKRYYWSKFSRISIILAAQVSALRTLLFVIFCNPPAKRRNTVSDPVRFLFTEQTKVTSSGSDNSIVQIVISLHAAIEKEYGFLTSRLYRVFRPKPAQAQKWQWRRICCVPNFIIALFVFICILGALALLFIEGNAKTDVKIPEQSTIVHSVLISIGCIICLILVSNLYTWMRLVTALIISHQRRIARNLSLLEASQTMNYITSLKSEVDLIVQMVQCLDAFIEQQTRLVVIVDGLDSCEQEKVLHVLDAVHLLFSDTSAPFLTVLAIDPHIIIKAIESNINRVFHNTSISGHEYLRNVVHLPFYLQNSGLRRVKAAQQASVYWTKKSLSYWNEDRECDRAVPAVSGSRKASNSSISIPDTFRKRPTKGSQKLKASDSMASSISNLHRIVLGAQDLTKVLLTDDYFSDVNPRSMRRLMNIVYVTGRLLKAFNIDFNWYHLASWVNITEQWPYRTSWVIMYYEMHENELDEMMSLKCIYEKIKDYIPSSKEDDPSLDLDHDERKFEVFLSFHSSNLLINDLKIFLPFTINLDPYIRKTIQEDNQAASEILKCDLRPSNQHSNKSDAAQWVKTQPQVLPRKSILASAKGGDQIWGPAAASIVQLNDKSGLAYQIPVGTASVIASPSSRFSAPVPWWNPNETLGPQFTNPAVKLHSQTLPNGQKLTSLTVDEVLGLLSTLEKIDQKRLQTYANTLKENNINGQVIFTCDLKELKEVCNMSFGDWELFRVLILSLREQEIFPENTQVDQRNQGTLINAPAVPHQSIISHRSSPSGCDSPDLKKKDNGGNGSSSLKLTTENVENRGVNRARSISSVLEKQPLPSFWDQVFNEVTMEDSMIVGALETLSEEALEDALEEKLSIHRDSNTMSSGITSNPLSPIISDPEEHVTDDYIDKHPVAYTLNSPSEVDIMYLKNLRDSPMLHVSALSLCGSVTDLETSSVGHLQHYQPVLEHRSSPILLTRTASNSSEAASVSSSPSKTVSYEKPKSKNLPPRPSTLIHDVLKKTSSFEGETNTMKSKTPSQPNNKSSTKSHDKMKQISQTVIKKKSSKKKKQKDKKDDSSSTSSADTEELLLPSKKQPQKKEEVAVTEKITSPQSEADGFYSDDEHTPLVSPFHSNKSSQYNLQSVQKHDKEHTPEKVIPKQSQSDASGCLKLRRPLERQFSIDSFLSDKHKLSISSADIQESVSASSFSGQSVLSSHGLSSYTQHVAVTPSPEIAPSGNSDSNLNIHTETIL